MLPVPVPSLAEGELPAARTWVRTRFAPLCTASNSASAVPKNELPRGSLCTYQLPARSIDPTHAGATPVPRHSPPAHVSPVEHALPSSHGSVFGACRQAPAPSHASSVQRLPSPVHAVPADSGGWTQAPAPSQTSAVQTFASAEHALPLGSNVQRAEQPSPSGRFPSSHSSGGSTTPFGP